MSPAQLLLLEDDLAAAHRVALHLRGAGYTVQHAAVGAAALACVESHPWDLVLLGLDGTGADAFETCRRLRQRDCPVPVILLSTRAAESDRVLGLELGADDYLAKPFSLLELTARVRALLRRVEQLRRHLHRPAPVNSLHMGGLHIDLASRKVRLDGAELSLTLREFDLLHFLARHPGRIFSRSELLQRVWGDGFDGYEHTVNSHVNRLRRKIESDGCPVPRLIETVWGLGYRFNATGLMAAETAGAAGSGACSPGRYQALA